jgi:pimeloyl-ACP methyl ester carboxylesterase
MLSKVITQISGVIFLWVALACVASDEKREAQIAQDVQKTLDGGHAVWLEAAGKKFLGLHTDTAKNPRAGMIILLHDTGGHPNQQAVIKNLRAFFPEHHWATLSIQLPVREATAPVQDYYSLLPEAKTRILEAIKFAKSEKAEKVVVIGYGLGGLMASYALSDLQNDDVDALVTISLPVHKTSDMQTLQLIPKLTLPMLDIYAENDMPDVVQNARDKKVAGKINPHYRQVKIDNEGHLFLHDDGILVKRIYSWLGSEELKKLAILKEAEKTAKKSPTAQN